MVNSNSHFHVYIGTAYLCVTPARSHKYIYRRQINRFDCRPPPTSCAIIVFVTGGQKGYDHDLYKWILVSDFFSPYRLFSTKRCYPTITLKHMVYLIYFSSCSFFFFLVSVLFFSNFFFFFCYNKNLDLTRNRYKLSYKWLNAKYNGKNNSQ